LFFRKTGLYLETLFRRTNSRSGKYICTEVSDNTVTHSERMAYKLIQSNEWVTDYLQNPPISQEETILYRQPKWNEWVTKSTS